MRYIFLVFGTLLLLISRKSFANSDSTKLKSISIGYYMLNDDNPFTNQKSYNKRNNDDHGLTLLNQTSVIAKLRIIKSAETSIQYNNYFGLFTRDIGTIYIMKKVNPDYDYFSYILKKHPDWDNVLLYNQVAITKNVNEVFITNKTKNFNYGLAFKNTKIDSDENQQGTSIQHWFHKTLRVRNFYHKPFIDSSIFKGTEFNYFSYSLFAGFNKTFIFKKNISLEINPIIGFWHNLTSRYTIVPFSPYGMLNVSLRTGKMLTETVNRVELKYNVYLEPYERLQLFSDPGTIGWQALMLNINFLGCKKVKMESLKKYYFLYSVNVASYFSPLGRNNDNIIKYRPSNNDKRSLTGLFNLKAAVMFK